MMTHEEKIAEYDRLTQILKEGSARNELSADELAEMEQAIERIKRGVYESLSPWDRVLIARNQGRPRSVDYLRSIVKEFIELTGDRLFGDDQALICGLGTIGGERVMIIAQEKGADTESRLKCNFGMPHPEGYRKALRCMQLAAKFGLPVICLIDTPGAHAGLAAEERGQGWAIAKNLFEMAHLPTPIIVVIIGEGCSGGALAIGVGDEIAMLEHSYYSVITPEGCASILWKDVSQKQEAARVLKMMPENLKDLGLIDHVIPEPEGGAHKDPAVTLSAVEAYLIDALGRFKGISIDFLVERRYHKFRVMGSYLVEEATDADYVAAAATRVQE